MGRTERTVESGGEGTSTQLCAIPARPRAPKGSNGVRAERVEYVAGLMATGQFRRGKTAKELTVLWGLSLQNVHEICAEASRAVQCSVNVSDVLRTFNEALDELITLGHDCKKSGQQREAIVAFSKVAELCMQVTRQRDGLPSSSDGERLNTTQKLIAAGWTPPPPEGLPAPTLDDPEMNDDD